MGLDWPSLAHAILRETTMFAAIGILIGGIDDLLLDLAYGLNWGWRRLTGRRDARVIDVPVTNQPMAILIGAWREAEVIGRTIRAARECFEGANLRLYIGAYPNDPDTIAAAL